MACTRKQAGTKPGNKSIFSKKKGESGFPYG